MNASRRTVLGCTVVAVFFGLMMLVCSGSLHSLRSMRCPKCRSPQTVKLAESDKWFLWYRCKSCGGEWRVLNEDVQWLDAAAEWAESMPEPVLEMP